MASHRITVTRCCLLTTFSLPPRTYHRLFLRVGLIGFPSKDILIIAQTFWSVNYFQNFFWWKIFALSVLSSYIHSIARYRAFVNYFWKKSFWWRRWDLNPQNFDFESNTYANSVTPPWSILFWCREVVCSPECSRNILSLSATSFGLQHLQLCRVLAEVVGFEPTTYAGVKVLCLEPYLATPLYGADSKNRTYNCPLGEGCYVHLTIPAYGGVSGTRTHTWMILSHLPRPIGL